METKSTAVKPIPEGYQSVIPYLLIKDATSLLAFLKQAFGAHEMSSTKKPDGSISHAEVRLGDSVVMLAEASETWKPAPAMLYFYVTDTDATYHKALAAGGVSLMEPADQFYGDRNAGIQDPSGNSWYIATRFENVSPEELQRREAARSAQK